LYGRKIFQNHEYRKKLLSDLAGKVPWKHRLLGGAAAYGRQGDLFVIPEPVRNRFGACPAPY